MIASADYWAFRLCNNLAGSRAWLDLAMVLLARYAPLLFVATLIWLWLAPGSEQGKFQDRLAVGRALAAAGPALALGHIIGWAFPRPRPFQDHMVRLLIARSSDPSFPSDHALAAFAIAAALVSTHPRTSMGLFGLGTLLAIARVFVGTHYPMDVLGGAILGGAIGGLIRTADVWLVPIVQYVGALWSKLFEGWSGRSKAGYLFHGYGGHESPDVEEEDREVWREEPGQSGRGGHPR